jgi:hypothetical protein
LHYLLPRCRKRVSKASCLFRKFSTEGIVEFDCRNTRTGVHPFRETKS